MIKVLGIGLFFLLSAVFAYLEEPAMAGLTFVSALLLLLVATVFRKTVDTEENAQEGMKVIKEALKNIFG